MGRWVCFEVKTPHNLDNVRIALKEKDFQAVKGFFKYPVEVKKTASRVNEDFSYCEDLKTFFEHYSDLVFWKAFLEEKAREYIQKAFHPSRVYVEIRPLPHGIEEGLWVLVAMPYEELINKVGQRPSKEWSSVLEYLERFLDFGDGIVHYVSLEAWGLKTKKSINA